MANLEKELKAVARTKRKDLSESVAITETQRLIADKGAEDMGILQEMGLHHSIIAAQELNMKAIELEDLEKKYGQIFTRAEIKGIAMKYALKFLRSDKYNGAIDPVMLQKMKSFFSDAGITLNKAQLGYKFFILAPSQAFNLEKRANKPVPPDPMLFYKLDGEGENFRLIHKWGADLTLFRRIVGWKYRYVVNYLLFWTATFFTPSYLLLSHLIDSPYWSLMLLIPAFIGSVLMCVAGKKEAMEPHNDMWEKPMWNRI